MWPKAGEEAKSPVVQGAPPEAETSGPSAAAEKPEKPGKGKGVKKPPPAKKHGSNADANPTTG